MSALVLWSGRSRYLLGKKLVNLLLSGVEGPASSQYLHQRGSGNNILQVTDIESSRILQLVLEVRGLLALITGLLVGWNVPPPALLWYL